MTIPEVNQIFLGGRFNDALLMGDLNLNSPVNSNVYLCYLKDDTWLQSNATSNSKDIHLYPNPTEHEVYIANTDGIDQIQVYNEQGQLIQIYKTEADDISIGKEWKPGIYLIQLISSDGSYSSGKLIKTK
ncbi:MAG: T9SS type A sorting domain-containing protein [Bacteroidales bacterium]|nr:T9SS type A sorting domain-containing protein [Bacteroidales bacterium]